MTPKQATLHVDERADGGECRPVLGQRLEVVLPENPTTGFRWHLVDDGRPVVTLSDDRFDTPGRAPGQGGNRRWTFDAVRPGRTVIRAVYRRSWQPANPSQRSFSITVIVVAKR
jgi:inhibitor of cysteine peptidase